MILSRFGNKSRIAGAIQSYFPKHNCYVEPFFGAGGLFFNKPKVKYNILNDLDSDVFNLYRVVMNDKQKLIDEIKIMPVHKDLLDYWKKNKETEPVRKALRFLLLSNFTFLGGGSSINFTENNTEEIILNNLDRTQKKLFGCRFDNSDFRKFLKSLVFRDKERDKANTFIYCDPPYIDTGNNYSDRFSKEDSNDLFDALMELGCKFAMSEFDNPFILDQAKKRNLNVITMGERRNLKNRKTEILITNFKNITTLF